MRLPGAGLAALLFFLVAACSPQPQPASPALWRVDGPRGERAWLFGTIHSLPRPVQWRTEKVAAALEHSDRIVVEIAGLADEAEMASQFARMSTAAGLPPLSARVAPPLRKPLADLLREGGMSEASFDGIETWAAALTLARIGEGAQEARNGVDRAVIASAGKRPVVELEGALAQLTIFDRLPEKEQRDLLALVVGDTASIDTERGLADAWRTGRMEVIEQETRQGLLADPELREALYSRRNRDWAMRIGAMLSAGGRPFVAVGAAHMAGSEGLPALLAQQGYKAVRIQ